MAVNEIRYKGVSYATDDDIKVPSGILYEVKALRSDSLEANSLTVTVFSNDKAIMGFAKNDKVEYFRNGRRVGVYYLQTVERVGSDAYTLSALSALGRLITMRHVGGIYTGQTVAEVVPQICGPVEVMIESVYASRQLYGYLPYSNPDKEKGNGRSARDNLSQVLFSIGASLGTDENGVMRVEKLWDGVSATITADQINENSCSTVYETPVSAVEVTEHQWVKSQDTVTLFEGTAEDGTLVTFEEPAHSLTAEGFAITEQGDNYAILSAGTGTLTGKSYNHLTRIVRRTVTEGAEENVVTVSDATLVSLTNSVDVAKRMADYYRHRETIRVDVEPGTERAGRVVQIFHPWDKKMVQACVESRETVISGILNSQTSALVGFTPAQPDTSQYYNVRQEILEDTEIVIPEGTTSIHAVLGSAGDDGQAGANGTAGTDGGYARINSRETGTSVGTQGKGGAGGKGGLGGSGGKVLSADLEVSPGDVLRIRIGLNAGQKETTITLNGKLVSSAQGAVMAAGYTDPTTGDVYSVPGVSGIDGAAGGNAQTTTADASSGGNVGEFTGAHGTSARLEDYTNTDKVADGYTQNTNSSTSQYGTFTGREDISTDKDGYVTFLGREKTIGGTANSFSDGTAYKLVSSDSNYTQYRQGSASKPNVTITTVTNTHKYKTIRARTTYGNLGSGGGGAAQGANASDAAGANAAAPDAPTKRGSGGNGGNGGGGGGGGGGGYVAITGDAAASAGGRVNGRSGGTPGQGSKGSHGSDGYAILYYGLISKSHTGPLVTSEQKWLLDALDRRMIV